MPNPVINKLHPIKNTVVIGETAIRLIPTTKEIIPTPKKHISTTATEKHTATKHIKSAKITATTAIANGNAIGAAKMPNIISHTFVAILFFFFSFDSSSA